MGFLSLGFGAAGQHRDRLMPEILLACLLSNQNRLLTQLAPMHRDLIHRK